MNNEPPTARSLVCASLCLAAATVAMAAPVSEDAPTANTEGCAVPPQPSWSASERWTWNRICRGLPADFDSVLGTQEDSGRRTNDRFDDARRELPADFFRNVLVREPYRSAVPPEGVLITGASVRGDLILRDAIFAHVFGVFDSQFLGKVDMNRLRTPTTVAFAGSTFKSVLSMDSATIGGHLNLTGNRFGEVVLKTAEVGGELSMSGSHVAGSLNLNGAAVRGTVFLRDATFADVDLTEATVGRQLLARGSTFRGTLEMGSLTTSGHLAMNHESSFADVVLRGARIGGQLSASDAVFTGRFDGQAVVVGESLLLAGASFQHPVELSMARVGGGLDATDARLPGLNLSGATLGGDLVFAHLDGSTVQWRTYTDGDGNAHNPLLALLNTSVGGLVDNAASWTEPLVLLLHDFTYRRLTPFGPRGGRFGEFRDAAWYADWLSRDTSASFQPYRQLAATLEAHGEDATAHDVLIAGRERQRLRLPWWSPERWWSWVLRWSVGYGYGAGELQALFLVFPLVLLGGVLVRWKAPPGPDGERPGFWYSVDMLLPGMWLDERHPRVALPKGLRRYFNVHRLLGYVLLLFVVAGLAGLTE